MSFEFKPAKLEGVGLFIAIAGSSRTGKTMSAMRIAKGIAGPGKRFAAIDTEGRRMSHYSNEFDFDVYNMMSPFGGMRFVEAAKGAQEQGYPCMVIDSFSLEWSGAGGVLAERERHWAAVNYDARKSDQVWNRVKGPGSEHRLMMNEFLQLTIPIIFCLRTNEVADHLGGGWKVEQDKRFLYEWTVGLTLHPDTPGMPRYDMVDAKRKPLWKVQDQHRHLFPEGKLIGEEAGAGLAAWRNSSDARSAGSAAVGEKRRTYADWLADLESDLDDAMSHEEVETIAAREGVQKALTQGTETVVAKVNQLIKSALDRVQKEDVPDFARNATGAAA
jgi:hypothetical protein